MGKLKGIWKSIPEGLIIGVCTVAFFLTIIFLIGDTISAWIKWILEASVWGFPTFIVGLFGGDLASLGSGFDWFVLFFAIVFVVGIGFLVFKVNLGWALALVLGACVALAGNHGLIRGKQVLADRYDMIDSYVYVGFTSTFTAEEAKTKAITRWHEIGWKESSVVYFPWEK